MPKSAKSHFVGENAAEQQQAALLVAKTTKTCDERGEGNTLSEGEIVEIPTALVPVIWSKSWELNGQSGRTPMIDLVTTTNRQVGISMNKFFQPKRWNNGNEKPTVPTALNGVAMPLNVVAKRFKWVADLWEWLIWCAQQPQCAALQLKVHVTPISVYEWNADSPSQVDYTWVEPTVVADWNSLLMLYQAQHTDLALRPA